MWRYVLKCESFLITMWLTMIRICNVMAYSLHTLHIKPAQAYAVRRLSPVTLLLVLGAHIGVAATLSVMRDQVVVPPQTPLMVEVLTAEAATQPKPRAPDITPPKPKPVARREQASRTPDVPVLAAKPTTPEPSANEVRAVPPAPLPPINTPPAPAVAAPVAHAAPAPNPVSTAPRFDADYLDNPRPAYPPISRHEREQGTVKLSVYVEASGLAGKVELASSSGHDRLDKAAMSTVRRWRFTPARRGAEAVADWVIVPIVFSLKE